MLLDFGWSELMLIGVVALVVIGPKDLPKEFHQAVDPTGSLAESLKPPELPNFSEPAALPADSGTQTSPGTADAEATGTAAPVIAPPDTVGHDIMPPKP